MNKNRLTDLRQTLHAFPELSGHEEQTAERVASWLKECNPDELLTGIGGHGIVAVWEGEAPGAEVVFRADLDALPIEEVNDVPYRSQIPGVAHLCGHDGHMTILCALAEKLSKKPPHKGRVTLLFQPSEENGQGAEKMLADPAMKKFNPDFVFALHNIPGYPLRSVIVKENSFSAAVNSILIRLNGKTAHAAEPENGINPAQALAEIVQESLLLGISDIDDPEMRIITPVYALLGEKAYGTSAGDAEIHLTLRCWDNQNLRRLEQEIENLVSAIAGKYHLKYDVDYTQTFFANMNDKECVEYVREAAENNGLTIFEKNTPFKWGEDFGFFTSRYKGCMFGLGAGETCPALHNPDYDFPDELIETGVAIFSGITDIIPG